MLEEEVSTRLKDIKEQQSSHASQSQQSQQVKETFIKVLDLIEDTPIERKELDKTDLWARAGMEEKL